MSKNGIIGLSVGAIALVSGLTFYTHSAFSDQINNVLASKKLGSAQLSLENQSSGLFSHTAQYKVTLSADKLQNMTQTYKINDAIELYINHHYQSLPLFVSSKITLDLTKGSARDFMSAFPNQTIEHLLSIDTNLLTQTQSSKLTIEPTTLTNEEDRMTVVLGELYSTAITDLMFKSGNVLFDFSQFKLELRDTGIFNLEEVKAKNSIADMDGMWIAPESTFSLAELSFTSAKNKGDFSINNLEVISKNTNIDSDAIDVETAMTIETIKIKNAMTQYDAVNTIIDVNINNFDKAGLIALDQLSSTSQNPRDIINAAQLIFQRGFNGSINEFNTTINSLAINSSGDFTVKPYTGNNLQQDLLMHVMTQINANYSINLGNNYAEVFPQFSPMLDGMTGQGFITKEASGNLTSTITIDKGAISANGQRIR